MKIIIKIDKFEKAFDSKRKAAEYFRNNKPCKCTLCNTKEYIGDRIFHALYKEILDYSNYICKGCKISINNKEAHLNKNSGYYTEEYKQMLSRTGHKVMIKLWKSPSFSEQVKTRMSNNHHNYDFLCSMYESRGWKLNDKGYVYLVKDKNNKYIKVGFTQNINNRLTWLGKPKLILLKQFNTGYEALKYEQSFHNKHKNESLYNKEKCEESCEKYPIDMLDEFLLELNNS